MFLQWDREGTTISVLYTFQFFSNFGGEGGGGIKSPFFLKFKLVYIILGGGGEAESFQLGLASPSRIVDS